MYKLDKKWVVAQMLVLLLFSFGVGLILYDSLMGSLVVLPIIPFMYKQNKEKYIEGEKKVFRREFKEAIEHVSANLNAGYSLENAVIGASSEMNKDVGTTRYMGRELLYIVNGLKYSYNIEELFVQLGERSGIAEVEEFGSLLAVAKRYGGNIITLIKQTRDNITQKSVVELEIDTTISSKRLEGRVMLVMPFAIVLYMKLTNSSYISGLYENMAGRIVMTVVFVLWFLSKCMIDKIVNDVEA